MNNTDDSKQARNDEHSYPESKSAVDLSVCNSNITKIIMHKLAFRSNKIHATVLLKFIMQLLFIFFNKFQQLEVLRI
jgi:hypothetical protein